MKTDDRSGDVRGASTDRVAWAAVTLLRQGMPAAEVRSVLQADDPVTVGRHLELHRERLAEQAEAASRAVDVVEVVLA